LALPFVKLPFLDFGTQTVTLPWQLPPAPSLAVK
jgi:hypothetical protein